MTKQLTHIDLVRRDAQELHKKISANIAKAEAATWADVQAVQADAASLAAKMKTIADTQTDAFKTDVKAGIAKLDAAAKLMQDKAIAGKDAVRRANTALLAGASNAAQSLSNAVANARSEVKKTNEPTKVPA